MEATLSICPLSPCLHSSNISFLCDFISSKIFLNLWQLNHRCHKNNYWGHTYLNILSSDYYKKLSVKNFWIRFRIKQTGSFATNSVVEFLLFILRIKNISVDYYAKYQINSFNNNGWPRLAGDWVLPISWIFLKCTVLKLIELLPNSDSVMTTITQQ